MGFNQHRLTVGDTRGADKSVLTEVVFLALRTFLHVTDVDDLVESLIAELNVNGQSDVITEDVASRTNDVILLSDRVNSMLYRFCVGAIPVARFPRRS